MANVEKVNRFDLLTILKQKQKKEKIIYEGAVVAFTMPDGTTGTWTLAEDVGVRLRLLQESDIQRRIMEISVDDLAKKFMLSQAKPSEAEKKGASYLG